MRLSWRTEAVCLAAAALLTTLVFANGSLDIAAARLFFDPVGADHWPRALPWRMLYHAATWITLVLLSVGLSALLLSFLPERRHWRGPATLVLLALLIGPGVLGNLVLKDHWHHPRPRDVQELGGTLRYVPSPLIGREEGASFPCGHCTVGFLYGIGWWIWRGRRPRWAAASLAVGLGLGLLLGAGRMAAGAHFLSDIIWSALLAYGVAHLLCYHVLELGERADAARAAGLHSASRARAALGIAAAVGGVALLLALTILPHGRNLSETVPLSAGAPRILEVEADRANITVVIADVRAPQLTIAGELHGFGLLTSQLGAHLESTPPPAAVLRYRLEEQGWLTDVDGFATLTVPAEAFERVRVWVHRGDIQVVDATRAGVVRSGAVELQLSTARGTVRQSARPPAP
ncbi:MAG TPA: phosphatase PAP2 family protein [Steroidobacteraceae bacterium]|jgi:lipid A 4'-phosphatase|nr:phosphatase PAP2 family protein [Steroidobacteraceae bacterium]